MGAEAEFEELLVRVDRTIDRIHEGGEASFRLTPEQQRAQERARLRRQNAPRVIAHARAQIRRLEQERARVTAAAGRGTPGAFQRLDAINRDIARYNAVINEYSRVSSA